MRSNLLHHIPRNFLRFPWSIVRRSSTFSTLEKTKIDQHPPLKTWWWRFLRFPKSIVTCNRLSRILISIRGPPGFDEAEEDTNEGVLAVKFIMGRDFAVTRSSLQSCWDRFAIAAMQAIELKWIMLNKHKRFTHHVWNSLWSKCLRVGFWCRCIWFGFWSPD